jgi:tetratricopeptide (TPR) repeat protein
MEWLVSAYEMKGDEAWADALTRLALKFPYCLAPVLFRGDVHFRKGQYELAVGAYEAAIEENPIDVVSWKKLGLARMMHGDYRGSIKALLAGLELSPTDFSLRKSMGDVFLATSDYVQAVTEYEIALRQSRSEDIFVASLSTDHFNGEPPLTLSANLWDSFIWPGYGEAQKALGNVNSANQIYNTVIARYEEVLLRHDNSLRWQYESWNPYQSCTKTNLKEKFVWSALGEAYRRSGEVGKALNYFEKALSCESDNKWLEEIVSSLRKA